MRSLVVLISIVALVGSAGVVLASDTDVQYDASSYSTTGSTAVHSLSWTTQTVANESNRFLAVGVSLNHDTTSADPITVASVTWTVGTTTQDLAHDVSTSSNAGTEAVRAEIWSRIAPTVALPTSPGTIKVTLNNTSVDDETIDTSTTGNTSVTGGTIHTGPDGSTAIFSDSSPSGGSKLSTAVVPSSVTIYATVLAGLPPTSALYTAIDDGVGGLSGTGVISGSVDYTNNGTTGGTWNITYNANAVSGTTITADYNYGAHSFTGTLANTVIEAGTVTISASVNSTNVVITDDGSGGLSGANVTGTIDYTTGVWTLNFTQMAPDNQDITADYEWQNTADIIGGASSFYNVNQTDPTSNRSGDDGEGMVYPNNPYIVIVTLPRWGVFGTVATTDPASSLTIPSSQDHLTTRWSATNGSGSTDTMAAGCTGYAPGRNTEIEWNLGASRKWAVVGINVKPPTTPDEARFAKARALATEQGTLVTWRTGYEVANLGFRVYREDESGQRVHLNRSLVAGSALFAGPSTTLSSGRSYSFWDAGANGLRPYWLEAIDLDGTAAWYGPFLPEPATEREMSGQLGQTTAWSGSTHRSPRLSDVGRTSASTKLEVKAAGSDSRRSDGRVGSIFGQWGVAASPAAKILVDQDGWIRLTRADLATAGFDPGPNATGLALINQGREQTIDITGLDDGVFELDDAIEFYGVSVDTSATGTNVYWLVDRTEPGRRLTQVDGVASGSGPVATFPAEITLRERSLYVAAVTSNGERDNFYGAVIGSDPVDQVLGIDALPPGGGQGTASLEVALQGITDGDHDVAVSLNGHELQAMEFSGDAPFTRTYEVDATWLRLGDNVVALEARNGTTDVSVADYLRLTWERPFSATEDHLKMVAPSGATVRVTGFASEAIRLFDLTNYVDPVEIVGSVEQDPNGTWSIEAVVPGGSGGRFLAAVTNDRVGSPTGIEANRVSAWHDRGNETDMVLIAHTDLLGAAQQLADYRTANGVNTSVVDIQDLYDEFSWGIKDPLAISAFLRHAGSAWAVSPNYVLLFGDASVDPRNYLGFGDRDLVPTNMIVSNFLKTANDDLFADLDRDGVADLAVGRLPAATLESAQGIVRKIIGYEQDAPAGWWTESVTLVADAVTADFDYEASTQKLEDLLPGDIQSGRINLGSLDQTRANQMIVDAFRGGRLLVNYDGHGSQAVWSSDEVFGNEDAMSLKNGFKLPVVVAMNCLNGIFHDVFQDSLAEAFLANPDGGAVAVWASSALADPTGQSLMNQDLYRSLFGGDRPTLGDAVMAAKANVTDRDTRNTWILFGDPSMQLRE